MSGNRTRKRTIGMPQALAVSLALHLVLLLLLTWYPVSEPSGAVREEPDITFTFQPEPEPPARPEASSDLFKVKGKAPEEPTDSSPPAAVLGDPAADLLQGDRPESRLQPPTPALPDAAGAEETEVVEPVDPGPEEDRSEEPMEETAVEEEKPRDAEAEPDRLRQPEDYPEEEAGEVAPIQEPEEKQLDLRAAVNQAVRSALSRPRRPSDGGSRDPAGSPQGMEVPDLERLPDSGFGFGNLQFESTDFDWSDYARSIYVAIWRAWHNRLYATTDEFERWAFAERNWTLDHQLQIRFTIRRNGQVTGIEIEEDSGCGPLDRSAGDALREVVLPPLPDEFPRDQETIHARFLAQGDIRILRKSLEYMKARGSF